MDFAHILKWLETILLFVMIESFFHFQITFKKGIGLIITIYLCLHGFNTLDSYFPYPLFYHFNNIISLYIFIIVCIYAFIFIRQHYTKIIYCSLFIVFQITFCHTVSLYIGSLFIESASAFSQMETWFYFAIPLIEICFLFFECWIIHKKLDIQNLSPFSIVISLFFVIEIIIMNYLGSLYLYSFYDSLFMLINVVMLCFIFILFLSYTHFTKKYNDLKMSQDLYNEAVDYHQQFNKVFQKQYDSLSKFNHDFKYYLYQMKETIHNNNLYQIEELFDKFNNELEDNQMIYTKNTLLNSLFTKKKEDALQNHIQLKYIVLGDVPEFIQEHDLYYLLHVLLDQFMNCDLKDILFEIRYQENIIIHIKTQTITKKDQDKILNYIKPILNLYHGHAFFKDHCEFMMTLCK